MKTYIKLIMVVLMPYIFMACKKDLTPTKSNLMIGSIDYDFKSFYPNANAVKSSYDFSYSNQNILKTINLIGEIKYGNISHNNIPKIYTPQYVGSEFILDNLFGQGRIIYSDEDEKLILNNAGKITNSKFLYGYYPELFTPDEFITKFEYRNGNLSNILYNYQSDSLNDIIFLNDKMISFKKNRISRYHPNLELDSAISYTLGYQSNTPDTSVIKVNGINNLILCIPFEVQETLPFLVVDDRLSLTGKKQNYLINSISVEEKRGGITQKTTNYTINYLYDLEGRITHVQWINNATLAIYREAVIGYL
jgi:hypothetical protein